jgi:twitching motility protein PilT
MDQALATLVKGGKITYETAAEQCHNIQDLNQLLGRANVGVGLA